MASEMEWWAVPLTAFVSFTLYVPIVEFYGSLLSFED
jgi:hypothetical protein